MGEATNSQGPAHKIGYLHPVSLAVPSLYLGIDQTGLAEAWLCRGRNALSSVDRGLSRLPSFRGRADRTRRRCADCGRPSGGQSHGSGDQDDTDCGNRPRDRLPSVPYKQGGADGSEGSSGPNHPGAPRSEDTPARAGSAIPAKTVNTKTYNASNFFVMVALLKQATSRVCVLSQFENG